MKVITDKKRLEEIFNRGIVSEILPSREGLFVRLLSGDRLKIYIGVDPTSASLHLSHAKNFLFLEDLRQLGHEVVILFGDFTARIGDPAGRSEARPQLDEAEVKKNVEQWLSQITPLFNFDDEENPPRVLYNSAWLAKLSLEEIVSLASNFTVQQMIERDMFEKRWKQGSPIYLHEFLYPLMQGYDSVAMNVDIELCGTDQIFNALAGRTLLKRLRNKEKFVIALNLLANPQTGQLMSKSAGTGVFLSATPGEMYGAIMAQPDEMIELFLINNTRVPLVEITKILASGPRLAKARAALEIVKLFYGEERAIKAQDDFEQTFSRGGLPDDLLVVNLAPGVALVDVLREHDLIASKTEWRRLVLGGAVGNEKGEKIIDPEFNLRETMVLKIGKRRFVKVVVE